MASRVMVTGAAGGLGQEVCKALVAAGHEVLALDRVYRRDMPVRLELVDLLDGASVYRYAEGCQAVVHLANYPGVRRGMPPQQTYRENVATDINVFQAAVDVGVKRLVFASSVQAMSGDRHGDPAKKPSCLAYLPIDGDAPACPRNLYALGKVTGEMQLRYYAAMDDRLSCTAIRYPYLMTQGTLEWIRNHPRDSDDHWGNPDEGFAYLYMADAASLVAAILDKQDVGYHQILPAAPDNTVGKPPRELLEKFYPNVPLKVPIDNLTSLVDISAITQRLGWSPKTVNVFVLNR